MNRKLMYIASGGQLVRVHLRPFARLGLDPEPLLQAFFRTATGNKPAPERLVEFAETAVEHAYRVVARALLPEELLCA